MPCDRRSSVPGDLSRRGWELTEAGDADAALACHREATGLPGAGGRTWFHRARSEQRFGHDAAARSSFGRSLTASLPPAEAKEAHFQLGKLQRDAGLLAEAEASYRAVLAIDPLLAGAHILLGVVLRELGRLEESVEAYGEGLRLNPSVAAAHYNRGQALLSLRRPAEAADGFRAALRADSAFSLAQEALGGALPRLGVGCVSISATSPTPQTSRPRLGHTSEARCSSSGSLGQSRVTSGNLGHTSEARCSTSATRTARQRR